MAEQEFDFEKELSRLMRSISRSAKTEQEIRQRLENKTGDSEQIEAIVAQLKRYGFIDDQRYAHEFVRSKTSIGHGFHRIRHKLNEKGCTDKYVDKAFAEQEEEKSQKQVLATVLERRLKVKGDPGSPRELKSLMDFCIRRGFDYDLVQDALKPWFDIVMTE